MKLYTNEGFKDENPTTSFFFLFLISSFIYFLPLNNLSTNILFRTKKFNLCYKYFYYHEVFLKDRF